MKVEIISERKVKEIIREEIIKFRNEVYKTLNMLREKIMMLEEEIKLR